MIPVSKPNISELELEYVCDAIKSGWVSSLGKYIDKFEQDFSSYCGTNYAVTVSNGTVGLHLALASYGIGRGDEVIVPDLTFVATANAVRMTGAEPIIVDVLRETYCIDPEQIIKAITPRTKAIIPVHLYGHPADMIAINKIADQNGLFVIEDAAEAHGSSINGKKVGSMGDCAVFSFYGNKIITSGEGGMITTNSDSLYKKLKHLRDHAMSKDIRYWHDEVGYNYRMTNLQAALGVAQLEKIDYFIQKRASQLLSYRTLLEPHGIECNPEIGSCTVNWMTCAVVSGLGRLNRDKVIDKMRQNGVDARPFFYPISKLPMYEFRDNKVSEKLSNDGFNLPTFVELTDIQIEKVCSVFLDALNEFR